MPAKLPRPLTREEKKEKYGLKGWDKIQKRIDRLFPPQPFDKGDDEITSDVMLSRTPLMPNHRIRGRKI